MVQFLGAALHDGLWRGRRGVRLIDRWISDVTIRVTLGLLLSQLSASLIVLL